MLKTDIEEIKIILDPSIAIVIFYTAGIKKIVFL